MLARQQSVFVLVGRQRECVLERHQSVCVLAHVGQSVCVLAHVGLCLCASSCVCVLAGQQSSKTSPLSVCVLAGQQSVGGEVRLGTGSIGCI